MFNFNLLKKELLQAKNYIKSCIFIVFILLIFAKDLIAEGLYFFIILGIVHVLTTSVDIMDGDKKGNYIITSLPVTRKEVVISKYLNGIVISVIATVFLKIISHLMTPLGIEPLNFEIAFSIICIITLYNSISYLLYFCTNPKASQIIRIIIYGGIFGGSFGFFSKDSNKDFTLFRYISNSKLAILSIVLIFIISIFISLKVYENKDL